MWLIVLSLVATPPRRFVWVLAVLSVAYNSSTWLVRYSVRQAKPTHVNVGNIRLGINQYNNLRGQFNRFCQKKPQSGKLDVPEQIHKSFMAKGDEKDKLFAQFVAADGNKDRRGKYKYGSATNFTAVCNIIPPLTPSRISLSGELPLPRHPRRSWS